MFAAYMHSVREAVNKRMALVLIGMAVFFAVLFYFISQHGAGAARRHVDGFLGEHALGPASLAVPSAMSAGSFDHGRTMVVPGNFRVGAVDGFSVEKGWVELTLTKGVARWKVLIGCYLSGLTLYVATLLVAMMPTAIWLWMKTGVGCKGLCSSRY